MSDLIAVTSDSPVPKRSRVTRHEDGDITIEATIVLTREQWLQLEKHHLIRAMSCQIGLDVVQLSDFVLHQVFHAASQ